MKVSPRAKVVLGLGIFVALVGYLVVLDLGVSAGRVHHGVSVSGIDIGGLSFPDAFDLLSARGEELSEAPIQFVSQDLNLSFLPEDVGWTPQPFDTTEEAMRVGRDDAPFGALSDRVRAWVSGVTVGWQGNPDADLVTELMDEWDVQAAALGRMIDRGRLRYRIRTAIEQYPRRAAYKIPYEKD